MSRLNRDLSAAWGLAVASRTPMVAARSFRVAHAAIRERSAVQKLREFAPFLGFLQHRPLETIVEIGSSRGGTFYAWCQIAAPDALIVGVDLIGGDFGEFDEGSIESIHSYRRPGQRVVVIPGDSHEPATLSRVEQALGGRRVDLLFIDGDHRYEGVKMDFEMYAPLATLVALHDVLPHPGYPDCQVDRFWAELTAMYQCREFVERTDWGGIGVVLDPPLHSAGPSIS